MAYIVSLSELPQPNPAELLFSTRVVAQDSSEVSAEIALPPVVDQNVLLASLGPGVDLAQGHLANLGAPEGRAYVTLRLHLEAAVHHLPAGEPVIARARVLEVAGRMVKTLCEVEDAEGNVVARSQSTLLELQLPDAVEDDIVRPVQVDDLGGLRDALGLQSPAVDNGSRVTGLIDVANLSNASRAIHGGAQVALFVAEAADSAPEGRVQWATLDFLRASPVDGSYELVTEASLGRTVGWARGELVTTSGRVCTRAALSLLTF